MAALSFIPSNEEIPVFAKHRSRAVSHSEVNLGKLIPENRNDF